MSQVKQKRVEGRVLVVDDHAAARESVTDVLRHAGYAVASVASAVEALPVLDSAQTDGESFDVVVTDLQMPGMDGLEFIQEMSQRRIQAQAIMVTAHATISSAVEAIRHGAFDYMEKPFDVNQLETLVARALQRRRLLDGGKSSQESSAATSTANTDINDADFNMVGNSPAMQLLRQRIAQVAPTGETVLICGESGTGKELVARAVHAASRRADGPLVSLNCPALSPQLAESELFGHQRGAFTGADLDRTGRFELAAGGAIFLDEITEIDLPLQAKLLRVLQERTFEPVGSSKTLEADVRVLASTNRILPEEITAGRFREDLYYRLAVVPLELPPLRERGDDVQLLADYFLQKSADRLGRKQCDLAADARELFAVYHWPGNVRELENLITRACVLNQGEPITAAELRPWLQQPENCDLPAEGNAIPVGSSLEEVERAMIVATLEHYEGHRGKTAEALGIGVRTLSGKLRSYGYAPRTKQFSPAQDASRQIVPLESAVSAGSHTVGVNRAA
ncbi:sigma-54-dependent transcriptional regulator [Adhaeretor mobilis]|uniref:Transcriptional regulatory protein ZraR n=1 Tax=Adhaeretor mobilis TaxID=1930276 RepID=A0A517MZ15_9BACT|nr:sigma-54 dependent transcriptional regulator [Adhaeretor mobilis]QDT00058.1 Transcriptional regulatory protein ZraR [Adhaeretor mobilis]